MRFVAVSAVLLLCVTGLALNGYGYEGGTKMVAAMNRVGEQEMQPGPILIVPASQLAPSKPVLRLLHRIPEPTLSPERIRVEKRPGASRGTKLAQEVMKGWF